MVQDKKYPNMVRIIFDQGGKVPDILTGLYNKRFGQKAIDDWTIGYTREKIRPRPPANDIPQVLVQKPKVEKDGEEKSIS